MYEATEWEQYEKMLNKQKLVDMMKSLKRQETINEFWRNANATQT